MSIETMVKNYNNSIEAMNEIINSFKVKKEENNNNERMKELEGKSKKELIEIILSLETKPSDKIKVEDVIKSILEDERCKYMSYKMIAETIRNNFSTNTSDKSIAWYPSNRKDWNVVKREALKIG